MVIFKNFENNYEIPPDKLGENAFDYLNSKIPAYELYFDDQIDLDETLNRIINKASGEMAKDVSEVIGVGVGLCASIVLFEYTRKDIQRIGLSKKKEKRLDFVLNGDKQSIQIETKGTVYPGNVAGMINHTHEKKINKPTSISKYGFIVESRKNEDLNPSLIHITDPIGDGSVVEKDIYWFGNYYLPYLMFILDNPVYNKVVKKLTQRTKFRKYLIPIEKIKYKFTYKGRTFVGQCYDNRLIIETIQKYSESSKNLDQLFSTLTSTCGKTKYFLGIDFKLVEYLNARQVSELLNYQYKEDYEYSGNSKYLLLSDGVLYIKSENGHIPEIDNLFTEKDVKSRLAEYFDYSKNEKHPCGAPCRSREIEGKACEIMTYRSNCHFHR